MPIEINELVIRAQIDREPVGAQPAATPASAQPEERLQQILEEIFERLREKNER